MDLTSLLQGPMGQMLISGVAQKMGMDNNQASSAIGAALPALMGAMHTNAQTDGGAGLDSQLQNHDGGILDNLSGFLGGDHSQGAGLASNILGDNHDAVAQQVASQSGISGGQAASIIAMAAPILMSLLSQQNGQQQQGGGAMGILGSLLGGQGGGQAAGIASLLGKFL